MGVKRSLDKEDKVRNCTTCGYQNSNFAAYRRGNIITCYVADEDKYF